MRPSLETLQPFLEAGESVRWSGPPASGVIFHGSDLVVVPFSLLWVGFVIIWNALIWLALAKALSASPPVAPSPSVDSADAGTVLVFFASFLIFGLVFLGFGYQFAIGRFISDAQERAKTLYAITDRRAIIAMGKHLREIRGYELTRGAQISVSERRDSTGSITFGAPDPWLGGSPRGFGGHYVPEFKFERIERVRDVARLIDEIQRTTPQ